MNDFGVQISKNKNKYIATFWFLDSNRIVIQKNKNFLTKLFAIRWSKKQVLNRIVGQYIKEKQ
jgi:hypothetical protein